MMTIDLFFCGRGDDDHDD